MGPSHSISHYRAIELGYRCSQRLSSNTPTTMTLRNTTTRDKHRRTIAKHKPPCHICGQDIDYTAPWLHPLSFTVDHLIPLNRGGHDTIENKAAAHRKCNRTKSDRLPSLIYVTTRTW
jgi:5-methylcytosine-specific restriction endonuclease McrA